MGDYHVLGYNMKKMLVLLNHPEDIDTHLQELREIATTHGITKVYLARLSRAFGSRARSIVIPHKLDMATHLSDAAVHQYLSSIAVEFRAGGLDAEPISAGLSATAIDSIVAENEISMVVTSDGRSGLCCWPGTARLEKQVPLLYEHVFGLGQLIPQKRSRGDNKRA